MVGETHFQTTRATGAGRPCRAALAVQSRRVRGDTQRDGGFWVAAFRVRVFQRKDIALGSSNLALAAQLLAEPFKIAVSSTNRGFLLGKDGQVGLKGT